MTLGELVALLESHADGLVARHGIVDAERIMFDGISLKVLLPNGRTAPIRCVELRSIVDTPEHSVLVLIADPNG